MRDGLQGRQDVSGETYRFLGLGLSAIVGQKSDEFSWKGLGSKLAYQSKRVEIETYRAGDEEVIKAEINDPWGTISANRIPKPRIYKFPPDHNQRPGTRVVVVGHPPHRREEPFTIEEIETFLQHRTFVGFTRERETRPRIYLTVTGEEKELSFRFPELLTAQAGDATILVNETEEGKKPGTNVRLRISMKGFYTWDAEKYNLSTSALNTGLLLSVMDALPFAQFITLAHAGDGPDLIVHFQEDEESQPDRYTVVEAERFFYNYKAGGHAPLNTQGSCAGRSEAGPSKSVTPTACGRKWLWPTVFRSTSFAFVSMRVSK